MEMGWPSTPEHTVETVVKLTWLQVTFARLGPKPWLTVVAIVELWDEGEVTGDLPIIGDLELLLLQLTELHILKLKLQSKEQTQISLVATMGDTARHPDAAVATHDWEMPAQCRTPSGRPVKKPRLDVPSNPISDHKIMDKVQFPIIQFTE